MNGLSSVQRKVISTALMIAAIIWIFLTIRPEISQAITPVFSLTRIGLSIVPAMTSLLVTSYIYFLILSRAAPPPLSVRDVIMPFVSSQVVRYLPGKFWGLLYQAQATANIVPARYTIAANVEHFAIVNLNLIAVAAGVFAYQQKGMVVALMVFSSALSVIFILLRKSLLQRVLSIPMKFAGESFSCGDQNDGKDLLIIGLLLIDWLLYLLACALILPGHGVEDVVIIATSYAIAWLAGTIVVTVPNGLFVREASFVWLSGLSGFDPADMLAFSIIARILFTLADLLCAVLGTVLVFKIAKVKGAKVA